MPCHLGVELSYVGVRQGPHVTRMAREVSVQPQLLPATYAQLTTGVGERRRLDWIQEPASQRVDATIVSACSTDSWIDECSRPHELLHLLEEHSSAGEALHR
jgi:hypothetical protein